MRRRQRGRDGYLAAGVGPALAGARARHARAEARCGFYRAKLQGLAVQQYDTDLWELRALLRRCRAAAAAIQRDHEECGGQDLRLGAGEQPTATTLSFEEISAKAGKNLKAESLKGFAVLKGGSQRVAERIVGSSEGLQAGEEAWGTHGLGSACRYVKPCPPRRSRWC